MYAVRYLTAKISEFPSHEIECSLSDIIEENVPEKYYLSRKQAEKLLYKENPTQGERIYSSTGLSCTLTCGSGGFGGHSGLYLIEDTENFGLLIKANPKTVIRSHIPVTVLILHFREKIQGVAESAIR